MYFCPVTIYIVFLTAAISLLEGFDTISSLAAECESFNGRASGEYITEIIINSIELCCDNCTFNSECSIWTYEADNERCQLLFSLSATASRTGWNFGYSADYESTRSTETSTVSTTTTSPPSYTTSPPSYTTSPPAESTEEEEEQISSSPSPSPSSSTNLSEEGLNSYCDVQKGLGTGIRLSESITSLKDECCELCTKHPDSDCQGWSFQMSSGKCNLLSEMTEIDKSERSWVYGYASQIDEEDIQTTQTEIYCPSVGDARLIRLCTFSDETNNYTLSFVYERQFDSLVESGALLPGSITESGYLDCDCNELFTSPPSQAPEVPAPQPADLTNITREISPSLITTTIPQPSTTIAREATENITQQSSPSTSPVIDEQPIIITTTTITEQQQEDQEEELIINICGDGIVERPEECDDGNNNNFDDCRNDCTIVKCGDGIIDEHRGEECDDGNYEEVYHCLCIETEEHLFPNDTCLNNCTIFQPLPECCSSSDSFAICGGSAKKSLPGICGCDTLDVDSDGDGMMDCFDDCPLQHGFFRLPCTTECRNCEITHEGTGCNNRQIENCVCFLDPICCDEQYAYWDEFCALTAIEGCDCQTAKRLIVI